MTLEQLYKNIRRYPGLKYKVTFYCDFIMEGATPTVTGTLFTITQIKSRTMNESIRQRITTRHRPG